MYCHKLFGVVLSVAMCGAANAQAQVPPQQAGGVVQSVPVQSVAPPAAHSPIAEEIKRINEQIALLSAQLGELDMRAKLAARQADLDKAKNAGQPAVEPTVLAQNELPFVKAIDGFEGRLRATLAMRDGSQQSVAVGDRIGGWFIREITVNSVAIARSKTKGAEVTRLGFGTPPAQASVGTPPLPAPGGAFPPPLPGR